jgi:hypothetical protein
MMSLHDQLVHAITEEDRKDQARAAKGRYKFNHYRLAIMLGAAQRATAAAQPDASPIEFARACNEEFTPCAWITKFFKSIGVKAIPRRDGYTFEG